MTDPTHALSFGAAAAAYDRFRPRYPPEAVRWALDGPDAPARVVELGAGTGILTRALLALGHEVTPVEPDPGMRDQLAAATPGVAALAGSAESVPLPDGTADAVLAGQAYHWFDQRRAHPEIARLLRSGGVFAPIWNIRDDRAGWVAELSGIARMSGSADDLTGRVGAFGPQFAPAERAEFTHHTTLGPQELIELVRTRSYYLTADPQGRRDVDDRLRELLATHPELAGRERFTLPYRTLVLRARRR